MAKLFWLIWNNITLQMILILHLRLSLELSQVQMHMQRLKQVLFAHYLQ